MISDTLQLKPRQRRVLDALEKNAGLLVPRSMIIEAMYAEDRCHAKDVRKVIDVTICELRQIMAKANAIGKIETVYGRGYRLMSLAFASTAARLNE